ncbi:MAG TPA: hypothetical protein VE010_22505 [Thermoanaerobaculia bacterium]|nr:hypothetical protein [Thermoanaerobaculia bacterium]
MLDREFVAQFEACTLPPRAFDHRNHVRLAWLYLNEAPLLEALTRFRDSLQRYAASLGAAAKYHETITFAFLFLIHERMQRNTCTTFDEFAAANPDLFEPILQHYYRPETLASELAKRVFVMPDAVPRVLGSSVPRGSAE